MGFNCFSFSVNVNTPQRDFLQHDLNFLVTKHESDLPRDSSMPRLVYAVEKLGTMSNQLPLSAGKRDEIDAPDTRNRRVGPALVPMSASTTSWT